jgi:hypothetical protein
MNRSLNCSFPEAPIEQWDPMYAEGSNCWPMMGRPLEVDTPAFEHVTFSLSPQEVGRNASLEC